MPVLEAEFELLLAEKMAAIDLELMLRPRTFGVQERTMECAGGGVQPDVGIAAALRGWTSPPR